MFAIVYRRLFLIITALIVVASIVVLFVRGLNPSIEFSGGSLTEVMYGDAVPDKTAVETAVSALDFGSYQVRESQDETGRTGYLIRTRDLTDEQRVMLRDTVSQLAEGGEVTRFTSVGPVIGTELKDKAVWAIAGVSLIIMLYVAFAFAGIGFPVGAWVYALITIFILIHDVLIPTAVASLFGIEVDVLFVMALLAVLGYSVNDTIVIFDRVRENLKRNRIERKVKRAEAGVVHEDIEYTLTKPYEEIVGSAVQESLARSVNTSLTTLLTLIALYIIGGTTTQTFALILIAGVVAGTYSSICIAAPLLVTYAKWQAGRSTNK